MRNCAHCGTTRCAGCGTRMGTRMGTSIRRDALNVAGSGGKSGGFFWGILIGVMVLFWPSIFMHGGGRIVAEAIWYGLEGIIGLGLLLGWVNVRMTHDRISKIARNYRPEPDDCRMPNLRDSDTFEGR